MKDDMERKGLVEEDAFDRRHWKRCIRQLTPYGIEKCVKEDDHDDSEDYNPDDVIMARLNTMLFIYYIFVKNTL